MVKSSNPTKDSGSACSGARASCGGPLAPHFADGVEAAVVYTTEVDVARVDDPGLALTTHLLQERIPKGRDVRPTGIGDRILFLNLNPNGQWAWLERAAGLPTAAAIADELLDESVGSEVDGVRVS